MQQVAGIFFRSWNVGSFREPVSKKRSMQGMTPDGSTATLASFLHGIQGTSPRNKRVSGRGNLAMPLVVLHVPVLESRQVTRTSYRQWQHHRESSCALQPREGGLVLHTERHRSKKGFDHIEKIMDGDLEDEMALEYQASPILHDFKKMKTPARLMQLLCDMPSGPRNAEEKRGYSGSLQQLLTITMKTLVASIT